MEIRPVLPGTEALQCNDVDLGSEQITLFVSSNLPTGRCPTCRGDSSWVHSHYLRRLGDLPWHGTQVQLRWRSRRFFCETASCPQKIFTERLPEVAGYGTILCDLERHKPIDLLPERSSGSFKNWLEAHPGVEIISRDRGDYYKKGATAGAPNATQVADRWHLLRNLQDAIIRTVDRHSSQVTAAIRDVKVQPEQPPLCESMSPSSPPAASQYIGNVRRSRRFEQYERVIQLHRQGVSQREIARQMGIHRSTVRRFLQAESFPERAARQYRGQTDSYVSYLRKRWQEGCHNAAQLTRELKGKGFDGSYYMVRRRVAGWRQLYSDVSPPSRQKTDIWRSPPKRPSPRRVAWLLRKETADLSPDEEYFLRTLFERTPLLKNAADLARSFAEMLRNRQVEKLTDWIAQARSSGVVAEIRRFAVGLCDDLDAVQAAFALPWSNGQTEGHVNRLKLIKRQMYGRANFDLLRKRFLYAA